MFRLSPGGVAQYQWGKAEHVELGGRDPQGGYRGRNLISHADGNAIAMLEMEDGVRAATYAVNEGWAVGPAFRWREGDGDRSYLAASTFASSGEAIAIWFATLGTGTEQLWLLRYRRNDDMSWGWGTPELVASVDPPEQNSRGSFPRVAADSEGNIIALWTQADGVRAHRYTTTAGWESAQFISAQLDRDATRYYYTYPSVEFDGDGNAIAVWGRWDADGRNHLYANRYDRGVGWGTPLMLDEEESDTISQLELAMDPDGNAIVVWSDDRGEETEVGENWTRSRLLWIAVRKR